MIDKISFKIINSDEPFYSAPIRCPVPSVGFIDVTGFVQFTCRGTLEVHISGAKRLAVLGSGDAYTVCSYPWPAECKVVVEWQPQAVAAAGSSSMKDCVLQYNTRSFVQELRTRKPLMSMEQFKKRMLQMAEIKPSLTSEGRIHISVGPMKGIQVCCPTHLFHEMMVWVKATGKGVAISDSHCGVDACLWRGAQGLRFYLLGDDSVEVEHL